MRLDPFESEASDGQIRKLIAWVMIDGSTGTTHSIHQPLNHLLSNFRMKGGGRGRRRRGGAE